MFTRRSSSSCRRDFFVFALWCVTRDLLRWPQIHFRACVQQLCSNADFRVSVSGMAHAMWSPIPGTQLALKSGPTYPCRVTPRSRRRCPASTQPGSVPPIMQLPGSQAHSTGRPRGTCRPSPLAPIRERCLSRLTLRVPPIRGRAPYPPPQLRTYKLHHNSSSNASSIHIPPLVRRPEYQKAGAPIRPWSSSLIPLGALRFLSTRGGHSIPAVPVHLYSPATQLAPLYSVCIYGQRAGKRFPALLLQPESGCPRDGTAFIG